MTHPTGVALLHQAVEQMGWGATKPPFIPPQPVPVEQRDEHYAQRARNWCTKALAGKADKLAAMPPDSGRNHALNKAAWLLYRFALAGHLDIETVTDALREAALTSGLSNGEIEATLGSASRGAQREGPAEPPIDENGAVRPADPFDSLEVDPATGEVVAPVIGAQAAPEQAMTPEEMAERAHRRAVRHELAVLRAREEARELLRAEKADREFREPTYTRNLTEQLALPRSPTRFAVDQLLPMGGNALLAAQFKAGKTTFITDLARCWVDQQDFLGRFPIHGQRRVALFNYELSANQYDEWLEQSGIRNTDGVSVLHLRGFRMDIRTPKGEQWITAWLRDHDIGLWVPDPFARAAVGVDENSNTEVGVWLDTLDIIKERAGVQNSVLPVHTGRAAMESGQERARGATRLDDWADVRWILTKDDQSVRYFRATGRDVEFEEEKLTFDADQRRLTIGGGDRAWEAKKRGEDLVVLYVTRHPGSNGREILDGLGGGDKTAVPRWLASAVSHNRLRMISGKGPAKLYFPPGLDVRTDSNA
jgi:hypothetical protein